jgi:hypothetical protein
MKSGAAKNPVILSLSKDPCEATVSPVCLGDSGEKTGTQRSFDKLRMTVRSMAQSIVILLTANG